MDGRKAGRPGRVGWRTWAGRPSWAGKTGQSGRTDRDGRTETGFPSMNAACGRHPTNAHSTKIRRSLLIATDTYLDYVFKIGNIFVHVAKENYGQACKQ